MDMSDRRAGMPKWLLLGLLAKVALLVCVVLGVLWYADIVR
jgi:hypothetical protein